MRASQPVPVASSVATHTTTQADQRTEQRDGAHLRGRSLVLARASFIVVTAAVIALNVLAFPDAYAARFTPDVMADLHRLQFSPTLYGALVTGEAIVYMLVYLALGLLVFWRRSDERMALFCAFMLVLFGGAASGGFLYDIDSGALPQALASHVVLRSSALALVAAGQVAFIVFFYLFPSGRFAPRWTRWLALLCAAFWVLAFFFPTLPAGFAGYLIPVIGVTVVIAQVYRYRRVSMMVERQQTKWVVFGVTCALLLFVIVNIVSLFAPPSLTASPVIGVLGPGSAITLALLCVPVCIALAILRSRLWDIDVIINRTLVYGALTSIVVGVYILVVGYLGILLRSGGNLLISLAATGLVAVLFQPLRAWLQRAVNRLMYGQRDEPYAVVARLGRRLEDTLNTEAVLPAVAETLAQALNLPYVALTLKQGDAFATAAVYGAQVAHPLILPLSYQAEPVGQLLLAPRRQGEAFTPADRRLLEDLARQVGVAAHAVRLTADLQRSREQLVTAREEERRRLRRDLHDGLGPTLAALALKAATVGDLIGADPEAAVRLSNELYTDIRATVSDIRRLVYALRPPRLDELGLVEAIRELVRQSCPDTLLVTVEAPEHLQLLSAASEVAVYRITQEALTNIVRHARARTGVIRLTVNGDVCLEIDDDGVGIVSDHHVGVGLHSMRERAAELGGTCIIENRTEGMAGGMAGSGVRVCVRLPLTATLHEEQDTAYGTATRADR